MRVLGLLGLRRFAPFFVTQALGAFNDNVFRFALMFSLTYTAAEQISMDINFLMNLAAALFILPFFLFSGIAGQLADKYEKSLIVRQVKLFELLIMALAFFAFSIQHWSLLMGLIFLMGVQSALFGPVKYAILPQSLAGDELVSGNALIGMGTFVAILLGTLLGGLLAGWVGEQTWILGAAVFAISLFGLVASYWVPQAAAGAPGLQLDWNIIRHTNEIIVQANRRGDISLALIAISWFWFIGSGYLTQFPNFSRSVLMADEQVATLLLALFSLGVGAGALLCAYWSRGKLELGLVPLAAAGIALFSIDLSLYSAVFPQFVSDEQSLRNLAQFIADGGWRVALDLFLVGLFGGLFIVPLYTLLQKQTPLMERARVIAALNVLNALAMVLSAVIGIVLLVVLGYSLPFFFLFYGLSALLVAFWALFKVRDPLLRFMIFLLSHSFYRVRHRGLENIPDHGPAIVVANHVSYVDALLLAGASHRPLRFVIDKDIHDRPLWRWFLRLVGTVPIISDRLAHRNLKGAFAQIGKVLERGEIVCIFPEGHLTKDGEIARFKRGISLILENHPVPVVPVALKGLWGSWFSHAHGKACQKLPRRFWSKVEIVVGEPVAATEASPERLREEVCRLYYHEQDEKKPV